MSVTNYLTPYLTANQLAIENYSPVTQIALEQAAQSLDTPGHLEQLPFSFYEETALQLRKPAAAIWSEALQTEAGLYLDQRVDPHNRIKDVNLKQRINDQGQLLKQGFLTTKQTLPLVGLYAWTYQACIAGDYPNLREKLTALYEAAGEAQPDLFDDIFNINHSEYLNAWVLLMLNLQ